MKNDYKLTTEWDSDILALMENKPSLSKVLYWGINIKVVYADKAKTSKGKPVIATIERVPDAYREITLIDYLITIYKPSLAGMHPDQIRIALFEQLLKIKIQESTDGTDVKDMLLRDYDYEGFKEIIDEYGVDWDKPYSRQMTFNDIDQESDTMKRTGLE